MTFKFAIGTLLTGVVMAGCAAPAAQESEIPSESAAATPSVSASVTALPMASSPPPSPSSAAGSGVVPALGWREIASFGGTNELDEPAGVTVADGQFVAVGRHHEYEPGSPGAPEARIWLSPDGLSWEAIPSDPVFERATLAAVLTAADGTLVVHGSVQPPGEILDAAPIHATWLSTDGRTWRRSDDAGLDGMHAINTVVAGGRGYLLSRIHDPSLGDVPRGGELWHSTDGLSWQLVYETKDQHIAPVAAGDEGFVAVRSAADGGELITLASADGREWLAGDALPEEFAQRGLASLRGDWFMVGLGLEGPPSVPGPVSPGRHELPVWRSANGLTWEPSASIEWPYDGLGFAGPGPLVSVGDRLFLSPYAAGAGPRLSSAGVWSSVDGRTWEMVDIGPDVTIVGGAEHAGAVVVVGYVGPGLRATMWINERP
jgi:hypothetical protein